MTLLNSRMFWQNVDNLLQKEGLTLIGLCEKAQINYKAVSMQRTRLAYPKLEQLYKMASALNISMDYLATGEKDLNMSEAAVAVEKDPLLSRFVNLCMKDQRFFSAVELLIKGVEKE